MLLLLFLQISFLQIHVCLLLVRGWIPPEVEPQARIQVQPVCLGGDLREQERGQWGNETGMRVEGSQHKGVRGDCWGVWGSIFQGTTHLSDVPERWIFSTISQLTLFEGCCHEHLLPNTWPALPGPSTLLWPRVAVACRNKTTVRHGWGLLHSRCNLPGTHQDSGSIQKHCPPSMAFGVINGKADLC